MYVCTYMYICMCHPNYLQHPHFNLPHPCALNVHRWFIWLHTPHHSSCPGAQLGSQLIFTASICPLSSYSYCCSFHLVWPWGLFDCPSQLFDYPLSSDLHIQPVHLTMYLRLLHHFILLWVCSRGLGNGGGVFWRIYGTYIIIIL